MTENHEISN